jgi:hypothetical protein
MNLLLWIYQFAFGCHHRHMSRVFTIKYRTYRVCFDLRAGIRFAESSCSPCGLKLPIPFATDEPRPTTEASAIGRMEGYYELIDE